MSTRIQPAALFGSKRFLNRFILLAAWTAGAAVASVRADPVYVKVAAEDDSAPGAGAGVRFFIFYGGSIDNSRRVVFLAGLKGTGVNPSNDQADYAGLPGGLTMLAREGNPAPEGNGALYAGLGLGGFNPSGRAAFGAALSGSGVTSANDSAIYVGPSGDVHLVIREGDAAPGVAGSTVTDPTLLAIGDNNQVVVEGGLSAGGSAVWVGDASIVTLALKTSQVVSGPAPCRSSAVAGLRS